MTLISVLCVPPAEAERICYSAAANDVEALKSALSSEGASVSTTDYCGRTPLHIATLGGCEDAVRVSACACPITMTLAPNH